MKKIILALVLFTNTTYAAKYMMLAPEQTSLEIPSQAILWKSKAQTPSEDETANAFLVCDDENTPRMRSAHGSFKFKSSQSCEKIQMMLRLSSPQCPLQVKVDDKKQLISSFKLECDNLKL